MTSPRQTPRRIVANAIKRVFKRYGYEIVPRPDPHFVSPDVDDRFIDIYGRMKKLSGFDMRYYTTYKTVEYLVVNGIPGIFVECGVYQGRQVLMMAETLMALGVTDRDLYLYDTFSGITKPTSEDYVGERTPEAIQAALDKWQRGLQPDGSNRRKFVTVQEVQENVWSSGYPRERFHFIKGNVLETLADAPPLP